MKVIQCSASWKNAPSDSVDFTIEVNDNATQEEISEALRTEALKVAGLGYWVKNDQEASS